MAVIYAQIAQGTILPHYKGMLKPLNLIRIFHNLVIILIFILFVTNSDTIVVKGLVWLQWPKYKPLHKLQDYK